ncbi:MAG TPA: hypothetical protein VI338_02040 [Nitrososphaera sp.]|nr:hypothetical protein [Nitrososphaera sp.]
MDQIDLPILNKQEPITKALRMMKEMDRRAVAVESGVNQYRMVMNLAVFESWIRGDKTLEKVVSRGSIVIALEQNASNVFLGGQVQLDISIEKVLDAERVFYGVAQVTGTAAIIVTRHEWLAHEIRTARKVCACTRNRSHQATSPPTNDGDKCQHGDGVYECY